MQASPCLLSLEVFHYWEGLPLLRIFFSVFAIWEGEGEQKRKGRREKKCAVEYPYGPKLSALHKPTAIWLQSYFSTVILLSGIWRTFPYDKFYCHWSESDNCTMP